LSDEEPILLKDVFGIAGYHTWLFPVDPVFDDYDLLREQAFMEQKQAVVANGGAGTVEMT
jgi:hypothetical protein